MGTYPTLFQDLMDTSNMFDHVFETIGWVKFEGTI
jgi:hypothetical protein